MSGGDLPVSTVVLKAGGAWITFVSFALLLYYSLKRRTGVNMARALALTLPFLIVLSLFYQLNPWSYLNDARWLLNFLLSHFWQLLLLFIFAFASAMSAYHFSSKVKATIYRSVYHIVILCLIGFGFLLNYDLGFLCLCFVVVSLIFAEVIRATHEPPSESLQLRELMRKLKELKTTEFLVQLVHRGIGTAVRGGEIRFYTAGILAILGIFIVFLTMPPRISLASLFILALADPSAAFVGRKYGRYGWGYNPEKSLEGSLAAFIVAFSVLLLFGFKPHVSLIVALSVMIFESFPLLICDNLLLPLMSSLLLHALVY